MFIKYLISLEVSTKWFGASQNDGSPYVYIGKVVQAPTVTRVDDNGVCLDFKVEYYSTRSHQPRILGSLCPVVMKKEPKKKGAAKRYDATFNNLNSIAILASFPANTYKTGKTGQGSTSLHKAHVEYAAEFGVVANLWLQWLASGAPRVRPVDS